MFESETSRVLCILFFKQLAPMKKFKDVPASLRNKLLGLNNIMKVKKLKTLWEEM
jgi:hypothetical protein